MAKRLLFSLFSVLIIVILAAVIIFYGRGYRYDPSRKILSSTGILSVSSYPQKASIYVDDKLTSATDASFSLPPGWYNIRISKDGYQGWEKRMKVQGEVVSQIDALLIPNNPSLKALTASGVKTPVLSHSSTKVAYLITDSATDSVTLKSKNGLYVLELKSGPLGNQPEPKQIFVANRTYNFDTAKIYWSADEKEIILAFFDPKTAPLQAGKTNVPLEAFLLSTENPQTLPLDVTYRTNNILKEWQDELKLEENLKLDALPQKLSEILSTNSANIRFSPDESKILYQATASGTLEPIIDPPLIGSNPTEEERNIKIDKYYVYDIKEDTNYFIADADTKNRLTAPIWYTDSKHFIIVEKEKINIVDYDGTNKRSVYSGPFLENVVLPWSPGGKIVILTNFNSERPLPDLYELDLR